MANGAYGGAADLRRVEIFTTGQIARACRVAPRTVSKWYEAGRLTGYKIPGSNDRRIPRGNLVKFMRENGFPMGCLAEGIRVLLVGDVPDLRGSLADPVWVLLPARCGFDAGVLAAEGPLDAAVIDLAVGRGEGLHMARRIRAANEGVPVIALANEDEARPSDLVTEDGFDHAVSKPVGASVLAELLQRTLRGGNGKAAPSRPKPAARRGELVSAGR